MLRGTTARTQSVLLAAVLLALQLFAPTVSFASAHPTHVISSEDRTAPETQAVRDAARIKSTVGTENKVGTETESAADAATKSSVNTESVSCGTDKHLDGKTPPFRVRDRQRSADSAPQTPTRPLLTRDPTIADGDTSHTVGAASLRTTRSSAAHSTAALQVFRC
ncbi:hypothetical protein FE633_35670 [Streptomyces montanus]|uniref:Secreted protein n=1 Tax=Streptomyces montanus TaxID=2580423 RepID=A0A5R9FL19_9ACTN|nr:hypothetical protein [Streptomyces montanus]TLS41533.1 hypothetical protein FE633_35670 [Streptomyces montanus]